MTEKYILDIAYLIASITFILGLKYLGHPETARKGSIIAWGKLEGKMGDFTLPLQQIVNMILLLGMLGVSGYIMSMSHPDNMYIYILLGLSLVYGVLFVFPIGGADMPVVISLLNSL